MAALPYMQLYIADYLADTMHLSTEEHGAYLLLMFNYWQTGKPIPKNRLAKIARLSDERWADIERTLSEFFEDDGENWIHLRIERDLENISSSPGSKKTAGVKDRDNYQGRIYFITGPDMEMVKIGYSKNPWARLSELRRSYGSLFVVATIKTVDKPESTIHSIFSEYHLENGWYQKNECIKALVLAISESVITTVDDISGYVANYDNYVSVTTVAATPTTNTDPDKDKDLKDENILSYGEKNATGPSDDSLQSGDESGSQKPKGVSRHEYPSEFEAVWKEYPRRPGSPDKFGAHKAWLARRREGVATETMLNGTRRYAAFVVANGKAGTEFIKLAKTFFGPSKHYEDDWYVNPEGVTHAKNTNPTNQRGSAVQQVIDAQNAERRRQGLAPLEDDGGDLRESLDHEERRHALDGLDSSDFEILG